MKEHHHPSGCQDSSSHNLSSLVQSRTTLESMSLPLIRSKWTSRFLMSLSLTPIKLQKMVSTSLVFSLKAVDGMKEKRPLRSPTLNNCTLIWRWSIFYQRTEPILTTDIHIAAQFTNKPEEVVPCRPLVIPPTTSSTFIFQCRRSILTSIGSKEVSQCWQCFLIDQYKGLYNRDLNKY